jgi:hypothetical protein
VTFDGSAQEPCTAAVSGVGGLSQSLTVSYTANTNAGLVTASASYAGDANHNASSGTATFTIEKAGATCSVSGYTGVFDYLTHGATDTCSGNGGESAGTLNLGAAYTVVPGGTAHWVFTGNNNYKDQSGDVSIVINAWTFRGFYQPVDMSVGTTTVYNSVKGGSTVPLKFEVFAGLTELTDVASIKGFTITQVQCSSSAAMDDIELTTTGGTTLRYDTSGGQFIQNWQTPKSAGLCYKVTMTTKDLSTLFAYFKLK